MIVIEGGCDKCGKLMQSKPFNYTDKTPILICNTCYDTYYSPEAIREQKLNQVLKKSIWKRLQLKLLNIIK